jgi:hypothetical protein
MIVVTKYRYRPRHQPQPLSKTKYPFFLRQNQRDTGGVFGGGLRLSAPSGSAVSA